MDSQEDLQELRKELEVFRKSRIYQLFLVDYEEAKQMHVDTITGLRVDSLANFFSREQAVGSLEQIGTALRWFETLNEEVIELIDV